MRTLLFTALLWLPVSANCQELTRAELDSIPGMSGGDAAGSGEVLQRPDTQRIMSELSTSLRLSSRQEDRIGSAVRKKTSEFDKLMKEYERNSAEEKKWRFKANESRYEMLRINREMPDTIREYLDDEQREAYDAMLEAAQQPAAAAPAPKPARKKVLVKRRRAPAAAVSEDEAGQVMVDKDARPAPKKKRIIRRKGPVRKPQPVMPVKEPAAPPAAEEPAAPPAEEADPGAYP